MMPFKRHFMLVAVFSLLSLLLSSTLYAEERKISKAEEMATAASKDPVAELGKLGTSRTAKLTEKEVIEQLKYMMVKGWVRIDRELVEKRTFLPMGLTLSPEGDFKPIFVETGEGAMRVRADFALNAVAKNLKAIAETRAVWAVGLMYIQAKEKPDGTHEQRIQVMTEHIAGWARHWSYPFKITDGEVKLGAPIERAVQPTYFSKSK